jgi:hypothetical protein
VLVGRVFCGARGRELAGGRDGSSPYNAGVPSRGFAYESLPYLELRVQAEGGPQIAFIGTVSSRVPRTVLSIHDATQLGLEAEELREAGKMTLTDCSEVACWSAAKPIRGQVHSESSPGGPVEPWGPVFELDPIFIENGSPLWGGDFFDSFRIGFDATLPVRRLTLSYRS